MIVGMWSVLPYAIGFAIMHLYEVYIRMSGQKLKSGMISNATGRN